MAELFRSPDLDLEDQAAIDAVHAMRADLAVRLRGPRRWTGGLRRTTQARAIQGSNSIEGYTVSPQDAVAAVEDEQPLSADERTWAEILAYRRVMTFVLNVAAEPGYQVDVQTLRSMHFMLLEHDLSKLPGRYRTGPIYVRDDERDTTVYEGPGSDLIPDLVVELAHSLGRDRDLDPLVRAAMAHLNLVMIHPFKDGNGRMSRALQTLVLAQDDVVEPTFSSIEEWLGRNTEDYYAVLAATGRGSWQPMNDTGLWVKFNLRAHHMQAQTLQRRFAEAETLWSQLDELVQARRLPERVADPLFDAVLGARVTRPTYKKRLDVEDRTATRDLARLTAEGLLKAVGKTRGRHYVADGELAELRDAVRHSRSPLDDPFPWLRAELMRSR